MNSLRRRERKLDSNDSKVCGIYKIQRWDARKVHGRMGKCHIFEILRAKNFLDTDFPHVNKTLVLRLPF